MSSKTQVVASNSLIERAHQMIGAPLESLNDAQAFNQMLAYFGSGLLNALLQLGETEHVARGISAFSRGAIQFFGNRHFEQQASNHSFWGKISGLVNMTAGLTVLSIEFAKTLYLDKACTHAESMEYIALLANGFSLVIDSLNLTLYGVQGLKDGIVARQLMPKID